MLGSGRVAPMVLAVLWLARTGAAGDFRVNLAPPTNPVGHPSVAEGLGGDSFVVWNVVDVQGIDSGAWGRRLGSDGLPLGGSFQIQSSDWVVSTSVARFADGSHVVAWAEHQWVTAPEGPDPGLDGGFTYECRLFYRTYLADGSPAGAAVLVEQTSNGPFDCSFAPFHVVTQPDGSWIIVYRKYGTVGDGTNAKRFPSQGNLPLQIDPQSTTAPTAAVDAAGNLAIAWRDSTAAGVFARFFAPDGTPQGPTLGVTQLNPGAGSGVPAAAFGSGGSLLIAWDSLSSFGDDTSQSVQARRFEANGIPVGDQFQVNTLTSGIQGAPSIAALPDQGYFVSWQSQGSYQGDNQGYSIQSRRFLADDTPAGPETQVNALETDDQISVASAADGSGRPFFVWQSGFDYASYEIRASDDRTDVGIGVTDGMTTAPPGATLHSLVTVTDSGPADAPGALVTASFPAALSCTWTCVGAGGASCASGPVAGDIDDVASIPVGGAATYDAACLVAADASGTLLVTATATAPGGLTDTNLSNNTATDTTDVVGMVIDDVAVDEGNAGTSLAGVAVRLLSPMATPVTVDFATGDGTAAAGSDYLASAGTLSFAPGETLKTIDVSVLGDIIFEVDETFFVTLSNATGAPIVDGLAVGTILNDDSGLPSGSLDELVHGSAEVRSLESAPGPAPMAQYWRMQQQPLSSYEVVVDGSSGDLGSQGPALDRVASDGSIVQHASGAGAARSLRWESSGSVSDESVRVQSRGCIDDCDAADVFRVRMWETTAFAARFNNSASQVTVQVLENLGADPVTGNVHFTDPFGALLLSQPFTLPAHGTLAMNTSALVPGASGSIRVTSDAGYGVLQGKAVAVEPATGFTFDTPLVARPR
jgi:hypothetical protein